MLIHPFNRLLACGLFLTAPSLIFAQGQGFNTSRQTDAPRISTPGETSETDAPEIRAPKMLGDEEFGEQIVLVRRANWEPWNAFTDISAYYTDNAALSSAGEVEDSYLRSQTYISYTNRLHGDLFVDASLSQTFFWYGDNSELDFDLLRADAALLYRVAALNDAFLFARYSYYRLTEGGYGDELFNQQTLTAGIQKVWKITRGQKIVAAYSSEFALDGAPSSNTRDEHSVFVGLNSKWTEKFSTSIGYRGAYYQFDGSREDWNHVAQAGVSYELTDWMRASLTGSASWNRSSNSFFDYDNIVLGGGLTFHVSF